MNLMIGSISIKQIPLVDSPKMYYIDLNISDETEKKLIILIESLPTIKYYYLLVSHLTTGILFELNIRITLITYNDNISIYNTMFDIYL